MRGNPESFLWLQDQRQEKDVNKIRETLEEDQGKNYILGIRENCLNLYYCGMSMAKIEADEKVGCKYTTAYCNDKKPLSYDEFWGNLHNIRQNIEAFVGTNDKRDHSAILTAGKGSKSHPEKDKQQWIMNMNNSDPKAAWYFVDMEYIYKGESKSHPYGRADLIAVRKTPDEEGIHDVAFIELKTGIGAYKASSISDEERKILKKDLFDERVIGIKLGSGLASHIIDYMHFFKEDFYQNDTRQEIINILTIYRTLGIIPEDRTSEHPWYDFKKEQLAEVPRIYIVTYPKPGECTSLRKTKEQFYKYLYNDFEKGKGSSSKSIENLLSEEQLSGLLSQDAKVNFKSFIENDSKHAISEKQKIGQRTFDFCFTFVDDPLEPNCLDLI